MKLLFGSAFFLLLIQCAYSQTKLTGNYLISGNLQVGTETVYNTVRILPAGAQTNSNAVTEYFGSSDKDNSSCLVVGVANGDKWAAARAGANISSGANGSGKVQDIYMWANEWSKMDVTRPAIMIKALTQAVGINTDKVPDGFIFAVNGKAIMENIRVAVRNEWPDYVFADNYHLPSLQQLEQYIAIHKHLPDLPTAEDVKKDHGIDLSEMNRLLVQKLEEQSLYIIQLNKKIDEVSARIKNNSVETR